MIQMKMSRFLFSSAALALTQAACTWQTDPQLEKEPLQQDHAPLAAQALAVSAPAAGTVTEIGINPSHRDGYYGHCSTTPFGSGLRRKSDIVRDAGGDFAKVGAIKVIDCAPFDGPGGSFVVDCPPSTSFTYCVQNRNDGVGNRVLLGVTEDTTPPSCAISARRGSPVAQVDVVLRDPPPSSGLLTIEFTNGTNVRALQPYVADLEGPLVVTASKVDLALPATLDPLFVADAAGHREPCRIEF